VKDTRSLLRPLERAPPSKEEIPTTKEEELEEITHRTSAVYNILSSKFDEFGDFDQPLSLKDLMADKKRSTVAVTFFELLNIRSKDCILLKQEEFYGDIIILT